MRPFLAAALVAGCLAACGSGQTANVSSTSAPASASQQPTLASCFAAWNASSTGKGGLDVAVAQDQWPVAVLATYSGPDADVPGFGGQTVRVRSGACLLIAHAFIYVQDRAGSWTQSPASPTEAFVNILLDPAWTQDHSNVSVMIGPLNGSAPDAGTLTQSQGDLVVLSPQDVDGTPPAQATPVQDCGPQSAPAGSSRSGTVNVMASQGVQCSIAHRTLDDYFANKGLFVGSNHASGYFLVDNGWHCVTFMAHTNCSQSGARISAVG